MTDLPHVADGDPHAPAHNAERDAINVLQDEMANKISLPPGAATGDLLRWDGTQWLTTESRFFEGTGSPNGVIAAPLGSRYIRTDGSQGDVEWIKRAGGNGNTGWVSSGVTGDTGWMPIGGAGNATFGAGWSNYPGAYTKGAYRLRDGVVWLQGLVQCSSARNTRIFTLPAGMRPLATKHMAGIINNDSTAGSSGAQITGAGDVIGRIGTAGYISLDSMSFIAEQ